MEEISLVLKKIKTGSDKNFGLFFSLVFVLLAVYFYIQHDYFFFKTFSFLSLIFLVASFFIPKLLYPLNFFWTLVGLILGTIFRPIVMGIIFFLLITPIAFLLRSFGRDELKLKKSSEETYWKKREPSSLDPNFFRNQF